MKNTEFEQIKLTDLESEEIKNKICAKFDKLNEERRNQLSHIKNVRSAIYSACSHSESGIKNFLCPMPGSRPQRLRLTCLRLFLLIPKGFLMCPRPIIQTPSVPITIKYFYAMRLKK